MTEATVRKSVQSTIAINLQHIRDVLTSQGTWGFSIAFDGATNREDSYLDVRLRAHIGNGIENCHILAIPMSESHTGLAMYDHIKDVLNSLMGELWTTKLLSVATNGASKI